MGSSCSSGQAHKDPDSHSNKSHESPSYQKAQDKKEEIKNEVRYEEKPKEVNHPAPLPQPAHQNLTSVSESMSPGSPAPDKVAPPATIKSQLLGAHLSSLAPKANRVVLFICAADSQDCKVEKGLIHREVYPGLREYMREKGFHLDIVDLCWSVHEKSPEPADLVLHELKRQSETGYLVPVVLLNECLGGPLVPKTLEPADLETAKQSDANGVLAEYYRLDSMAQPPCYRLNPPSTKFPKIKCEDKEERERAVAEWREQAEKIIGVFLKAFSNELRDTYLTTVVEQEVQSLVLMSGEVARRCVWLNRSGQAPPQSGPQAAEATRRLTALQNRLKRELVESHIHRVSAPPSDQDQSSYLQQVVNLTRDTLTSIVDNIIAQHNPKRVDKDKMMISDGLVEEVCVQSYWSLKSSQCSPSRQQLLDTLAKGEGGGVVVLVGEEGSGKTTLAGRLAACNPTRTILSSANLTRRSATLESTLYHVLLQLDFPTQPKSFDLETYTKMLPVALDKAAKEGPLTVIMDGIDQYREFGSQGAVEWVPTSLPDGVKLVLTVADGSSILASLKRHLSDKLQLVQLPPLEGKEAESFLVSAIMEYNHSLEAAIQESALASLKHSTIPLYIKVLAWQTWWCKEYNDKLKPTGDLRKQIDTMFSDLEGILGKEKVEICLSLLTAAKWGLLDSEMIDMLASNELFHTSTTYLPWAGAPLFWSQLHMAMGPFLRTCPASGLTSWRYSAFRSVAATRYSSNIVKAHSVIATYFKGELWKGKELKSRVISQPNKTKEGYNVRKLEELPYAVFKSAGSMGCYLEDHEWILDKLCGTSLFQMVEDWVVSGGPTWLGRVLRRPGLDHDGRQLYSQLVAAGADLPAHWARFLRQPPTPSLMQISPQLNDEAITDGKHFDIIRRLPENPNFVVTVTTEKEEISVWNLLKCERVRTLKNIPQPLSIEMIDDFRCVVLCRRELRVYDLNHGLLLSKLKGVMNQKMPYFGLHGVEHLVALSRNRMYVNLMNITTGDLVTTFKAGEDRFLNSLLVSGDGRILVCGDETQKPFPLLVWNLASRKLLYDLRIAGHDFITSLSAITHQGHYVCCVAKEVDEPSPNFIVVYDLQSGTLFKKWKPGVDCVSVDISSRDSCVVSGHTDGTILVWDLVTGNCRWTLEGHIAPVVYLRLDESACLSMDTRRSDIRLWDLATGGLRAVLTAPEAVICCEVSHAGRLVALSLESTPRPLCLQLCHAQALPPIEDEVTYGEKGNAGKEFTVSEEVR